MRPKYHGSVEELPTVLFVGEANKVHSSQAATFDDPEVVSLRTAAVLELRI